MHRITQTALLNRGFSPFFFFRRFCGTNKKDAEILSTLKGHKEVIDVTVHLSIYQFFQSQSFKHLLAPALHVSCELAQFPLSNSDPRALHWC